MASAIPFAQGASSLIAARGAIDAGKSQAGALMAQASENKTMAQEAVEQGQYGAYKQDLKAQAEIGHGVAEAGASGIRVNESGSVQNLLIASSANAELDRQNILHQAELRRVHYENEASMEEFGAGNAITASHYTAIGDVLTGASKVGGYYTGGGSGGSVADDTDISSGGGWAGADSAGAAAAVV